MNSCVIHNAEVVTPQRILHRGAVCVERGKILAVSESEPKLFCGELIDAQGMYVAPGFIDLHVHGGNGADFMDGTSEAFETIVRFYASHGVTALQATTTAAPLEDLARVLETARRWMEGTHLSGAQVLGVHLEGPFLSVGQRGCHLRQNIRPPLASDVDRLMRYEDVITEMTLAPELPGCLALIRRLCKQGIVASAGHSQAREEDMRLAIEAGLTHTTHIYSAMSTVVRDGPWRIPGLLETALAYDELTTEMIADGRHLPSTLMRLVLKCKGLDRVCLVSDAMRGAGMPEGNTFIVGGQEVIIENGVAMLADHTSFASSITPIEAMVRNVIDLLGLSIEQAVPLVSRNPARILGIDSRKGTIEPGKDADLVVFDDDLQVKMTLVAGRVIYSRGWKSAQQAAGC